MNQITQQLAEGFAVLIQRSGKPISIRYYNVNFTGVYDDDVSLSLSGTLWTSGITLPPRRPENTTGDPVILEQGKYVPYDQILLLNGSTILSTGSQDIKIGLGSPIQGYYTIIQHGAIPAETEDTKIYKKIYLRKLANGSLIGE